MTNIFQKLAATTINLIFPLSLALIFPKACWGVQINSNDFGANALFESFEGITPNSNAPQLDDPNLSGQMKLGVNELFTFNSGVTLTSPFPNSPPPSAAGVILGDFSIGPVSFAINGIDVTLGDVPDGSAFLASNATNEPLEFIFPTPVLKVGAPVTASFGTSSSFITLSAFDDSGNFLELATISSTENWGDWKNNFLGLENSIGIKKISFSGSGDFTGRIIAIDQLTFEVVNSVPEPSSRLGIIALCGLGAAKTLKRKLKHIFNANNLKAR